MASVDASSAVFVPEYVVILNGYWPHAKQSWQLPRYVANPVVLGQNALSEIHIEDRPFDRNIE